MTESPLRELTDDYYNGGFCPEGFYCIIHNDDGSLEVCPKGYHCPLGTTDPYRCTFGTSTCPNEQMAEPKAGAMFVILLIFLAAVLLFGKLYASFSIWIRKRKFERMTAWAKKGMELREQREANNARRGALLSTADIVAIAAVLEQDDLIEKQRCDQ